MEKLSNDEMNAATGRERIKVRGTASFIKVDGEVRDFEFTGQQPKGEPVRKDVKKARQSQLYETTGEKEGSIVAHLRVNRDAADPVAEMYNDLAKLTKGMVKTAPKTPDKVSLSKDVEGLEVYNCPRQKRLLVYMTIDTKTAHSVSQQLFRFSAEVNKIICSTKL